MHKTKNAEGMKPGWRVWRFEQMATNVNTRIDNPSESGMEHYVGLEHLDSDSLKIRRWGTPEDVEATKLMFKKGDIIFGRRRAYQRKLGVAEFDGICSAHAMVLRAKPDAVLPEFLPLFMQSDLFMNRAVSISVGSLSPTINWKTMAVQEFCLPPIDEQGRIARLLESSAKNVQSFENAEVAIDHLRQSLIDTAVNDGGAQEVELQELCCRPITYGIVQAGPHIDSGIPYIRVSDMTAGDHLRIEGMLRTSMAIAEKYSRSAVSSGDIVFALRGDVGLCRIVPSELHGANLTQGTARISIDDVTARDYVYWALRSSIVRRQIERVVKGSTFKEITLASLRSIRLRLPGQDARISITRDIAKLESASVALKVRTKSAKLLSRELRNSSLEV